MKYQGWILREYDYIQFTNHVQPPYVEITWESFTHSKLKRNWRRGAMNLYCFFAQLALLFALVGFGSKPDG
jgi:hypothetical protein